MWGKKRVWRQLGCALKPFCSWHCVTEGGVPMKEVCPDEGGVPMKEVCPDERDVPMKEVVLI